MERDSSNSQKGKEVIVPNVDLESEDIQFLDDELEQFLTFDIGKYPNFQGLRNFIFKLSIFTKHF